MSHPALEHLMGAYFHLDWHDEYPDARAAVEDFISGEPHLVGQLPEEIDTVLGEFPSEGDLAQYLRELDACYTPTAAGGGYRGWLASIADQVRTVMGSG